MGTFKRLNDQQKQQAQAEAAMPGAYENNYDADVFLLLFLLAWQSLQMSSVYVSGVGRLNLSEPYFIFEG